MVPVHADVVGESDIGLVRERNEDRFLVVDLTRQEVHSRSGERHNLPLGQRGLLLSVLDGMGGAAAGDQASLLAAQVFSDQMMAASSESPTGLLRAFKRAIRQAHREVLRAGKQDPKLQGMGTTLTAAAVADQELVLAHVGDSRAYLFRGASLMQLTEDHSLTNEIAAGRRDDAVMPYYDYSNVIIQALGVSGELSPFLAQIPICRDDLVLLCTDGLSALVPADEIERVLAAQRGDLAAATQELIALAKGRGGRDNITVVLARFDGSGLQAREPGVVPPPKLRVHSPGPVGLGSQNSSALRQLFLALLLLVIVASGVFLLGR